MTALTACVYKHTLLCSWTCPSSSCSASVTLAVLVHREHLLPINHLPKYGQWAYFQKSSQNRCSHLLSWDPELICSQHSWGDGKEEKLKSKMEGGLQWVRVQSMRSGRDREGYIKAKEALWLKKEVTGEGAKQPELGKCQHSHSSKINTEKHICT